MKTDIQTINFHATNGLLDDVHEVLSKLTQFEDRITGADVYLKMHEAQVDETREAHIKIYLPGQNLYAAHKGESFYQALHEAADKVRVQLKRKRENLLKKR